MKKVSGSILRYSESADARCEAVATSAPPAFELAAAHDGVRLLACGGRDESCAPSARAVFLAAGGAVEEVRPLPRPRCRHAVAALAAGEFLAIGGVVQFPGGTLAVADDVLIYSAKTDDWRPFARVPRPAAKMAAEVVDNHLFVIAGDTGTDTAAGRPAAPARVRDDVQVLDLATGRWRFGRPKPFPETGVTSATRGPEIWVVSSEDEDGAVTDTVEVYDTREDTWRRTPAMPTPRTSVACGFVNGRLHCVNGQGADLEPSGRIEVFDPATNAWSFLGDLDAAYASGYANWGDQIWVVGGVRL